MADSEFELQEIARLIAIVETRDLLELIYEDDERRIVIRGLHYGKKRHLPRGSHTPAPPAHDVYDADYTPRTAPAPILPEAPGRPLLAIMAPMVGVFYRAPAHGAPPYVEVGDRVETGQTIGLIEAMKVFSEVPADHAGTVAEIRAHSGQLVRTGEPLIYLIED